MVRRFGSNNRKESWLWYLLDYCYVRQKTNHLSVGQKHFHITNDKLAFLVECSPQRLFTCMNTRFFKNRGIEHSLLPDLSGIHKKLFDFRGGEGLIAKLYYN